MRLFFFIFQVNLRNQEIVYQHNITEKYYKIGDPNYIGTCKDCIRMALIFADFKMSLKSAQSYDNYLLLLISNGKSYW